MSTKLPMITAVLCFGYFFIMLIGSIPGGDCLGGYMLIAAVSIPWLWLSDIRGPVLYLLFFANVVTLVVIAAIAGALIDVFMNREALRQKLRGSIKN